MRNIYKCVCSEKNNKMDFLDGIPKFLVCVDTDKIKLKPITSQTFSEKEFVFSKIDKVELWMAVGRYSSAITVNNTVCYVYDLNIYTREEKWILEFKSIRDILEVISCLRNNNINIEDPIKIQEILSKENRLEIEKYFIRNSKRLEKEFNIEQTRAFDRYINL